MSETTPPYIRTLTDADGRQYEVTLIDDAYNEGIERLLKEAKNEMTRLRKGYSSFTIEIEQNSEGMSYTASAFFGIKHESNFHLKDTDLKTVLTKAVKRLQTL